jgi:signal peptidase
MRSGRPRPVVRRRWGLIVPIGTLGLVLLAPLAALFATTWVLGWRLQVISTPSMSPLYPAGTLVAVEPIDASAVQAGMVIVFRDPARPDRLVAHRAVMRIPADQPLWQTKGDANRDADPWHVAAADVRGRVRWGVPGLGWVVSTFHGWSGAAILVGSPLALLAAAEVSDLVRRRRKAGRNAAAVRGSAGEPATEKAKSESSSADISTLTITLTLPQAEIDSITEAAGTESVASLATRALRNELRSRKAAAYADSHRHGDA